MPLYRNVYTSVVSSHIHTPVENCVVPWCETSYIGTYSRQVMT